jgi:hypothetical protein
MRHLRLLTIVVPLMSGIGCGGNLNQGPFGPPRQSTLLVPFAGNWTCDFEKTIEAQRAAGASDEEIAQLRKLDPQHRAFRKLYPDLNFSGDLAVGHDNSEYRFFSMHQHGDEVCGKAWHHEDRFDPGDMSKCYVRLMIKDDCLYMREKMKDGNPDLDDPDLLSTPPPEGGSTADCKADQPGEPDWSDWFIYVFTRKK